MDKIAGCRAATFDREQARYTCSVTGDGCFFLIPDEQACYKKYEDGPIAFDLHKAEEGARDE